MVRRIVMQTVLYLFIVLFFTGCWDQVNIEDHGFVLGIGIDMADDDSAGDKTLAATNQMVSPSDIPTATSEGTDRNPYINLTLTGDSLFTISKNMAKEVSRVPFYEHAKLIFVSEEVAENPEVFGSMLDVFIRDVELRRGIKVLITEDKTKDILSIDPEPEQLPVMYVDMITENSSKLLGGADTVDLGDLHSYLLNDSSYVIPKIFTTKDRVAYKGMAVFDGHKDEMIGSINRRETKGLNLIKGEVEGGVIKFKVENHTMSYELRRSKSKVKINSKEDPKNMAISIEIDVEGDLAEMYGSKKLLDAAYLKEIEDSIAEEINKMVNETIEKAQKEFKLDILDIDKALKRKHFNVWKKIRKNWEKGDNYFSTSQIDVLADVRVRETGATDRAKGKKHE